MSGSDESLNQIEEQLDGLEQSLGGVDALNERQAQHVGERMDRLASRLLELSPPPAMATVHEELGSSPASAEEFDRLAERMSEADGEG